MFADILIFFVAALLLTTSSGVGAIYGIIALVKTGGPLVDANCYQAGYAVMITSLALTCQMLMFAGFLIYGIRILWRGFWFTTLTEHISTYFLEITGWTCCLPFLLYWWLVGIVASDCLTNLPQGGSPLYAGLKTQFVMMTFQAVGLTLGLIYKCKS